MRAEADNVRKRAERDVQSAHKFGLEKFVTELLGVVDSLERAIDSMGTADNENDAMKSAREGLTLTLKMFAEALVKQGVMPVNPKPKDMFDPSMHEAMAMVENPDQEGGTILQLIQKGYWLNDRLIRPARVIVVKQDQPKLDEEA
jgi:molecular chaperone GrpE